MNREEELLWNLKQAVDEIANYYMKNNQYQYESWWKRLSGSVGNAIEERINPNQDILRQSFKQWKRLRETQK
jgi:hypothetical protein